MKYILPTVITLYFFSLIGEFGSFWWVFDLFSHWRTIYLLGGLLLLVTALVLKRFKWAFIAGSVLIYHVIVVAAYVPLIAATPVRAGSDQETMTVAFANTYWKNEDSETVIAAIEKMDTDVIFLEEMQPDQFEVVRAALPEYSFALHAPVDYAFDMGVLSKVPVKSHAVHFFMPEVPLIEVVVELDGKELHLLGVHPHSPVSYEFTKDRNEYLRDLFEYADASPDSMVVGGDFNITQFSPVYRELLADSRMIDTQSQYKLTSTWPASAPKWAAIPIDQVFVTPDVLVTQRYRGENTGSDHWPIVVEVGWQHE